MLAMAALVYWAGEEEAPADEPPARIIERLMERTIVLRESGKAPLSSESRSAAGGRTGEAGAGVLARGAEKRDSRRSDGRRHSEGLSVANVGTGLLRHDVAAGTMLDRRQGGVGRRSGVGGAAGGSVPIEGLRQQAGLAAQSGSRSGPGQGIEAVGQMAHRVDELTGEVGSSWNRERASSRESARESVHRRGEQSFAEMNTARTSRSSNKSSDRADSPQGWRRSINRSDAPNMVEPVHQWGSLIAADRMIAIQRMVQSEEAAVSVRLQEDVILSRAVSDAMKHVSVYQPSSASMLYADEPLLAAGAANTEHSLAGDSQREEARNRTVQQTLLRNSSIMMTVALPAVVEAATTRMSRMKHPSEWGFANEARSYSNVMLHTHRLLRQMVTSSDRMADHTRQDRLKIERAGSMNGVNSGRIIPASLLHESMPIVALRDRGTEVNVPAAAARSHDQSQSEHSSRLILRRQTGIVVTANNTEQQLAQHQRKLAIDSLAPRRDRQGPRRTSISLSSSASQALPVARVAAFAAPSQLLHQEQTSTLASGLQSKQPEQRVSNPQISQLQSKQQDPSVVRSVLHNNPSVRVHLLTKHLVHIPVAGEWGTKHTNLPVGLLTESASRSNDLMLSSTAPMVMDPTVLQTGAHERIKSSLPITGNVPVTSQGQQASVNGQQRLHQPRHQLQNMLERINSSQQSNSHQLPPSMLAHVGTATQESRPQPAPHLSAPRAQHQPALALHHPSAEPSAGESRKDARSAAASVSTAAGGTTTPRSAAAQQPFDAVREEVIPTSRRSGGVLSDADMKKLTEQVYGMLERKLKIAKERRGL